MRIILVTDSHLAPTADACNANWHAAKEFAGRLGADLTIHLGDITVDGTNDLAQFDWALRLSEGWPTPLRFLPGNHDIGDNPPGPGAATHHPLDLGRLADYRAAFGDDYWAMAADGWWVIGLDAQLLGSGTEAEAAQWEWLAGAIAETEGRPVAVLLHKPLFRTDPADPTPHIRYVPHAPRRKLLALLAPLDLRLVASGHTHQYLDQVIAGVRHLWVPSSAFYIPDTHQERIGEKVTGIGVLELTPDGHRFDLVCAEGVARNNILDHPIYPLPPLSAAGVKPA
jgi:3',5'-cyclic AMP phosphodiesterase CpdA